jgi:hypothetical protein
MKCVQLGLALIFGTAAPNCLAVLTEDCPTPSAVRQTLYEVAVHLVRRLCGWGCQATAFTPPSCRTTCASSLARPDVSELGGSPWTTLFVVDREASAKSTHGFARPGLLVWAVASRRPGSRLLGNKSKTLRISLHCLRPKAWVVHRRTLAPPKLPGRGYFFWKRGRFFWRVCDVRYWDDRGYSPVAA